MKFIRANLFRTISLIVVIIGIVLISSFQTRAEEARFLKKTFPLTGQPACMIDFSRLRKINLKLKDQNLS